MFLELQIAIWFLSSSASVFLVDERGPSDSLYKWAFPFQQHGSVKEKTLSISIADNVKTSILVLNSSLTIKNLTLPRSEILLYKEGRTLLLTLMWLLTRP